MPEPNDHTASKGLRAWWASPPRSGLRLIIAPWEYRHLRAFAGLRIAGGLVLFSVSALTLGFGGNDAKTYSWALAFLAAGAGHLAYAFWELSIVRSQSA
ncbi:MAG: hypothetical protein JO027_22140 [Solirubrobacterales bacterium]|nr:hypothetical protein [Solirubrobacterales bacterium]